MILIIGFSIIFIISFIMIITTKNIIMRKKGHLKFDTFYFVDPHGSYDVRDLLYATYTIDNEIEIVQYIGPLDEAEDITGDFKPQIKKLREINQEIEYAVTYRTNIFRKIPCVLSYYIDILDYTDYVGSCKSVNRVKKN